MADKCPDCEEKDAKIRDLEIHIAEQNELLFEATKEMLQAKKLITEQSQDIEEMSGQIIRDRSMIDQMKTIRNRLN